MKEGDGSDDSLKPSAEQRERIQNMTQEETTVLARLTVISQELSDIMRGWPPQDKEAVIDLIRNQICGTE